MQQDIFTCAQCKADVVSLQQLVVALRLDALTCRQTLTCGALGMNGARASAFMKGHAQMLALQSAEPDKSIHTHQDAGISMALVYFSLLCQIAEVGSHH